MWEDNTQECGGALWENISRLLQYTSKALMEKLELKSREGFRRNYLHPAVEVNLIRMTIPDKPNSRNQRYVKIKRRMPNWHVTSLAAAIGWCYSTHVIRKINQ